MNYTQIPRLSLLAVGILLMVACSTDPNQQKLNYLNSGQKYLKEGKPQEAVIEFRNAIRIDPRSSEAHSLLADAYLNLNNAEAAFQELRETVAINQLDQIRNPAHRSPCRDFRYRGSWWYKFRMSRLEGTH